MANEENLKPFKEGEAWTGNKEGRPPGTKNRSTIARKILEMRAIFPKAKFDKLKEIYPELTENMTVEEVMTIIQIDNAVDKADDKSYRAIMDSAYGAPKMTGDLTIREQPLFPEPIEPDTE